MLIVRTNAVAILFFAALVVIGREKCAASEPAMSSTDRSRREPVAVILRPQVQTDSRLIRLVDVASVTGGDPVLREQIKQLDIEDALSAGESVTILPPQVEFRMRIAGIDVDRVAIRGKSSRVTAVDSKSMREAKLVKGVAATGIKSNRQVDFSSISVDEGPLEREIIQAAKNCLRDKLPWPTENVDIRLSQPLSADIRRVASADGYECSAEMRTTGPAVGRVQVRVIAEALNQPGFDVIVSLEVRHFEKVVLATKAIERGHVILDSDLYLDRQDVTELSDYCLTTKELIGMTAKRPVRALAPLRSNDVDVQTQAENSILIKRREQVKMVAKIAALSVTATGEALQDGRLGDVIRIRNLESNATVQGRVTGPGEVEISF